MLFFINFFAIQHSAVSRQSVKPTWLYFCIQFLESGIQIEVLSLLTDKQHPAVLFISFGIASSLVKIKFTIPKFRVCPNGYITKLHY